uniref:Uncharacterized protein n=1 Tax=Daphnia galeata TaxID=27404 RepID=A0A8J2WQN4_9CRUS|nr:unnamed protein product [Daphnia galeata]
MIDGVCLSSALPLNIGGGYRGERMGTTMRKGGGGSPLFPSIAASSRKSISPESLALFDISQSWRRHGELRRKDTPVGSSILRLIIIAVKQHQKTTTTALKLGGKNKNEEEEEEEQRCSSAQPQTNRRIEEPNRPGL